jgi:hypothetical protein
MFRSIKSLGSKYLSSGSRGYSGSSGSSGSGKSWTSRLGSKLGFSGSSGSSGSGSSWSSRWKGLKGKVGSFMPSVPSMGNMGSSLPSMGMFGGLLGGKFAMMKMILLITAVLGALYVAVKKIVGFKNYENFQNTPEQVMQTSFAPLVKLECKTLRLPPSSAATDEDLKSYINMGLQKGFRTLFLDVDYVIETVNGVKEYTPKLVYKTGNIIKTSFSIGTAIANIINLAFSDAIINKTDPVIVILNIVRSPIEDRLSDPEPYLKYLDNIASELKAYETSFLGLTPIGNFSYFQKEQMLINETTIQSPSLQGKLILFCNGNMTYYGDIKGNDHLNHYVNARIFMNDPLGLTLGDTISPGIIDAPAIAFASANSLSKLERNEIEPWAISNKQIFNIALPGTTSKLSYENLQPLINMGINSIPVYMDFNDTNNTNLVSHWGIYPWVFRPSSLR